MLSYEKACAFSLGALQNTQGQSDPFLRDAAVFVSLLSIPNIGWLEGLVLDGLACGRLGL